MCCSPWALGPRRGGVRWQRAPDARSGGAAPPRSHSSWGAPESLTFPAPRLHEVSLYLRGKRGECPLGERRCTFQVARARKPRRSFQRLHISPTPSPLPPARPLASVQFQISLCVCPPRDAYPSLSCSFPYSTSPIKGPEPCGLLRRGWRRGLGPGPCPPSRLFLGSSAKGGQSPPCHGRDVKVKNRKLFVNSSVM